MKKFVIIFLSAIGIACISNSAIAQTGVLNGWTSSNPNSVGGTSHSCPPDPTRICTTNTLNPDGTKTIVVYQYDQLGKLNSTLVYKVEKGEGTAPNAANGHVHSIKTDEGETWMQLIEEVSTP